MEKRNSSTILIEVLLKTIDKMGIKKTIQVLEVSQNYNDDSKRMIDTIVLVTCNHFGISQSTLIKGRKNVANRTNAIGVCAVLLLRLCNLSLREIADILRKDPTLINKYIRKIDTLDLNFKEEIDVVTKMEAIKEDIRKQLEIK